MFKRIIILAFAFVVILAFIQENEDVRKAIYTISYEQNKSLIEADNKDNNAKDWFLQRKKDHSQTTFPDYVYEYIEKYGIIVIGSKEKEVYLTFNCGYEFNNYTLKVLDILRKHEIKAAFFITGGYLKNNKEIVIKMVEDGHIVGNHGNTHSILSKMDLENFICELKDLEDSFKEITRYEMSKYMRPASGVFSERVLALSKELNYDTVFWSMAYKDWETSKQPGKDVAYAHIINYIHDGSIIMLHTVSKSNIEALEDVIIELKKQEYIFKTLDEFE